MPVGGHTHTAQALPSFTSSPRKMPWVFPCYQALSDSLRPHFCQPSLILCMFCTCHPLLNDPPWLTVIISNSFLLAMSDERLQGWGPRGSSPRSTRYRLIALPLPGRKILAHTLGSLAPGASTIPGAITMQSKVPC